MDTRPHLHDQIGHGRYAETRVRIVGRDEMGTDDTRQKGASGGCR